MKSIKSYKKEILFLLQVVFLGILSLTIAIIIN